MKLSTTLAAAFLSSNGAKGFAPSPSLKQSKVSTLRLNDIEQPVTPPHGDWFSFVLEDPTKLQRPQPQEHHDDWISHEINSLGEEAVKIKAGPKEWFTVARPAPPPPAINPAVVRPSDSVEWFAVSSKVSAPQTAVRQASSKPAIDFGEWYTFAQEEFSHQPPRMTTREELNQWMVQRTGVDRRHRRPTTVRATDPVEWFAVASSPVGLSTISAQLQEEVAAAHWFSFAMASLSRQG